MLNAAYAWKAQHALDDDRAAVVVHAVHSVLAAFSKDADVPRFTSARESLDDALSLSVGDDGLVAVGEFTLGQLAQRWKIA